MAFRIVIPARYGSHRLPGKPLKQIAGKPMIQWVYEAAAKSSARSVTVATDDQRVVDCVREFGGEVCLTAPDHESGTDRLWEVAQQLNLDGDEIVVNVQGDEPLLPAEVIDQVAYNLAANAEASAATLSEPLLDAAQCDDPNTVKVVCDHRGLALYFSRASIPWFREAFAGEQKTLPANSIAQRHIGLYAYRVSLLDKFVSWPIAPLEAAEKLEQLRILANGHVIHVAAACREVPGGVDTPADLARVQKLMEQKL